ncbi:P-loop NTPase fold protein [Vibrio cyclitrophicus]|uniref:KAP family P-loop NTPase fold protein n=1 Tax=Vibrio cyclitrophicus TaxID=47951 RepID=UPI000AEE6506|nr:P-loop NTPase fold protein [Vibrio cyclitrophicus]
MKTVDHASRYEEWNGRYNWSTCITNRKEYGKFLVSILTSEKNGFVLNLNGAWGTGKTEFLRRIYVELAEQSYPVVYIDAWESDFLKDPLTVVCTELLNQLGFLFRNSKADKRTKKYKQFIEQINGLLYNFNKLSSIIQGAQKLYASGTGQAVDLEALDLFEQVINFKTPQIEVMRGVDDTNTALITKLMTQQNDLVDSMEDIRKQISTISHILNDLYALKSPIVILLDELDRCRPDYAIKMLEIIKHFFNVDGCTFLIATDTESLESSINAVYGEKFDSERYLKRFFNQRVSLKRPLIYEYVVAKEIEYSEYEKKGICIYPFGNHKERNDLLVSKLLGIQQLELRDVEQVLAKLASSLNYIAHYKPKGVTNINISILLSGIIEHHINDKNFGVRQQGNISINGEWSNVAFTDDFSVGEFLSLQMTLVFETYSRKKYEANVEHTFGAEQLMLKFSATDFRNLRGASWRSLDIIESNRKQEENYANNPESYWFWEDYKNMIGLASNIE